MTETNASGRVVPSETTVAPMTILGSPVRWARSTTPSIIQSAPLDNRAMQTAMMISRVVVDCSATNC